jgi:glucokinase
VSVTTNIPWVSDEKKFSNATSISDFVLANDLEIVGHSIGSLSDEDLVCIHRSESVMSDANKVVIAPGTGLGQALLIATGDDHTVVPTEGGHADFAPQNELQYEIHRFLADQYRHVSIERLLSGQGICSLFDFFAYQKGMMIEKAIEELIDSEDKAEVISRSSLDDSSVICRKTMETFASILGAHAGNMALSANAKGGIYLAGGIPRKNIHVLKSNAFVDSYLGKGRLVKYVENCPVYVVIHNNPGIPGALHLALKVFSS